MILKKFHHIFFSKKIERYYYVSLRLYQKTICENKKSIEEEIEFLMLKAKRFFLQGNVEESIECYDKILKIDPANKLAQIKKDVVNYETGIIKYENPK